MWKPGQILSSALSTMPFMPVHHFISRKLKSDECSGSILLSPSAYPLSLIVRELFWAAAVFYAIDFDYNYIFSFFLFALISFSPFCYFFYFIFSNTIYPLHALFLC